MGMLARVSEKVSAGANKGKKVQHRLAFWAARFERVALLLDWTVPENTIMVVYVLMATLVVTLLVSWDHLVIAMKLNFGLTSTEISLRRRRRE